jgi:hypothetical protein
VSCSAEVPYQAEEMANVVPIEEIELLQGLANFSTGYEDIVNPITLQSNQEEEEDQNLQNGNQVLDSEEENEAKRRGTKIANSDYV